MTKEECLEALRDIECNLPMSYINSEYGLFGRCAYVKQIEILKNLIYEHFNNPPLKFEELNKGYPIYDNDEIVCGWKIIYMIDKEYKQLLLIDEEGNVDWVNYEENRFYRKEVQE
jgi:hypothetical protein